MTIPIIRRARADEAGVLTELAMRAKASWGYSEAFMAACRAELTFTPQKMAAWDIWIGDAAGVAVGMVALHMAGGEAELEDFFVEPDMQRQGLGARLMNEALAHARSLGATRLGLDADPNAETIYERLGFRTVGRSPSGSILGRTLPRMELVL